MLRFRGTALIYVLLFCALTSRAVGQAVAIQFVDESGLPVTEMLEDGTARVRVTATAANADPAVAETLAAQLQTLYTQDQETLTLTETGADTGVFQGSIHLNIAPYGTVSNGILDTGNSNAPDYLPDEVMATFGTATATARMRGSRVSFIDDFGRLATTFPVGGSVGVRVEQPVSDNPGIWDEITNFQIQVRDGNLTNYYYLTLYETGQDSGVFEGWIPSATTSNSYTVIRAAVGLPLQAVSVGPYTPTVSTANATFTGGQVLLVDTQGQPASVYMEGTRAYLRVIDHLTSGPVTAQVTAEITGDQETVALQETSAGSGIFQGSIGLLSGAGAPGNGVLETGEDTGPAPRFDTLHASYTDSSAGTSSAAASTLGYRIWFIDAYGSVVSSYPQGARAYVRIEWHNFTNPNAVDTIAVRLRSAPGDDESFPAIETGPDTGIFEGSIPLDGAAVSLGNGRLQAGPGDEITADRDGVAVPRPVSARVEFASVQFLDEAGRPTVEVLQNGFARVRVVSPADNQNPAAVESVTAQVSSRYKLDVESLTLSETGPDTGVFEGSIPLAYTQSNGLPGNGQLETQDSGDVPTPKPDELTATFGGYSAQAITIGSRVVFIDDFGRETTAFPVGANVGVRLVEPYSNSHYGFDTIYNFEIAVRHGYVTSYYYLTLYETARDTGVFEGLIPSSPDSTTQNVVRAAPGWLLQATRFSPVSATAATAQATFTGGQVSFVDAQGQPASVYLEGTRAYLRVEDHLASGPLTAQVTADLTGDQENVTLQQTSPGLFVGSIGLRLAGAVSSGNGTLETTEVFGPPFRFDTLRASYVDSTGTASTAAASTLGYRVWFLDASGAVVSSYVQSARVYVRLEDHNHNDPARIDKLYAQLDSDSGDQEFLEVNETGLVTGIYEGSIALDDGGAAPGDGQLQAQGGEEIRADRHGAWFPAPARARIDAASVEFIDEAGSPTGLVLENDTARVRVASAQDNVNPAAADSIVIQLHSLYANDTESVTLTETGPDTGVFEGAVPLRFDATPAAGNGTLETRFSQGSDPEELTATYGPYNATAHTEVLRLAFVNLRGQKVTSYPLRSTVRVRVETHIDNTPAIDTFPIYLQSVGSDFQTVAMTETGADTGIFLGSAPSSDQPSGFDDGVLTAVAGQTLTVQIYTRFGTSPSIQATVTSSVAPQAVADTAEVVEGSQVSIDVLANDIAGGGPLSVAQVTQGEHGTVTIDPQGTVTYASSAGFNGTDSFTYIAADPQGGEALATVMVTITPGNRAPFANADTATVEEDGMVGVAVLGNDSDPDGDTLTVDSVTQGDHGTVAINPDNTVRYVPAADYNGSDAFTYTISDGNGGTATATVTVTVTSANDAPAANADAATVAEDGTVDVAVLGNDSDPEGDTLTVTAVTQGAHGTVVINPDKTVKYTPAANYNGSDSFTYTISDGNGGTATATVTITVTPVNDAPVANADAASVAEDGFVNVAVLANDSDADGNVLGVASVTQGAHGAVVINPDKTVKYTPAANYNGSDSFTYTISDGNGGTATAAVTINVTPVNDAPVAANDSTTVTAGGVATVAVLTNDADVDGPSLSVASATQGAHGTVAISGSQVTYTAALYVGADSFTYTVSDGAGGTATAMVTVNVTAPPRVATGIQARYNFNEGSGATVTDSSGVGTALNLTIASPSSVSWTSGGLTVNTATSIASPGNATKIISAAQSGNALTVEAWIQPASLTLTGPARILTLTKNASQRNLVFGQAGSRYETQLKTSTGTPSLQSPASSLNLSLTHVVYTRSSSGQAVYYINGVQVSTATTTGTFATWGTDHKLILSDNWRGSYFLMAVYGRALSGAEVQQNYLAGANAN